MGKDFATELDELITLHKGRGADLGEMIADLEGQVEGLSAELGEDD